MKKLDIANSVANRKYKRPLFIIYLLYRIILGITYRKFKLHFNREADVRKEKGGCILLFNHQSRLDHYYALRSIFPKRMSMIAEYNEFFRSHLQFVFKLEKIVPKKNYCNDVLTIKSIFRLLKEKSCVALAPEGLASNDGLPKPIVPGTGHLIKKCKVPVYFLELRGSYLVNNKTCLDIRIGDVYCTTKLLFSVDDVKNLSAEEIDTKINEAFRYDEYKWQKEHHIKHEMFGNSCSHLEEMLFDCPKCGKRFTNKGVGNEFRCTNCGNGFTLDEYYDYHPFEGSVLPLTQSDWVNQERMRVIKEIRKDNKFSFTDNVSVGVLPNDHYLKDYKTCEVVANGKFTIDHDGVHFRAVDHEEYNFDVSYNEIYTVITVTDSTNFSFYLKGEYREIRPEGPTTLYMNMLIEEMHRLHVNFYKAFPWNSYMYEESDSK